jgi:hypothetical protein
MQHSKPEKGILSLSGKNGTCQSVERPSPLESEPGASSRAVCDSGQQVASGHQIARRDSVRLAQDIENARAAFVLALAGIMVFWRFLLRIVLGIVAVAVVVGAYVLLQGMHH